MYRHDKAAFFAAKAISSGRGDYQASQGYARSDNTRLADIVKEVTISE